MSVLSAAQNKDPRDIIISPVVSEKSYGLIDEGKYTFVVAPDANKTEIKLAIEKIFSVKVATVNTLNRTGKTRRTRFGSPSATSLCDTSRYPFSSRALSPGFA